MTQKKGWTRVDPFLRFLKPPKITIRLAKGIPMDNPSSKLKPKRMLGVTLVELMITIAVISILTAIAIPAYNGYIRESHLTTMRSTIAQLRVILEDFRLENGSYGANGNLVGLAAINGRYNWNPTGDMGGHSYTVSVTNTNSYDVWGIFNAGIWVRCDNRFSNCCDPDSGTAVTSACPP